VELCGAGKELHRTHTIHSQPELLCLIASSRRQPAAGEQRAVGCTNQAVTCPEEARN